MGFFLFLIALTFTTIFTILWILISILYHLITLRWGIGIKAINIYFYNLAIIIDVFANESLSTLLNYIMIKGSNKFLFGNDDRDTLSYIIAKNRHRKTLTTFGQFWATFLELVDPGHLNNSILFRIERYTKFKIE